MKTQKERVLAKCGEIVPTKGSVEMVGDFPIVNECFMNRVGYQIGYRKMSITLSFDQDTPEDDPVWPIAAKILEIGEEESLARYPKITWKDVGALTEMAESAAKDGLQFDLDGHHCEGCNCSNINAEDDMEAYFSHFFGMIFAVEYRPSLAKWRAVRYEHEDWDEIEAFFDTSDQAKEFLQIEFEKEWILRGLAGMEVSRG